MPDHVNVYWDSQALIEYLSTTDENHPARLMMKAAAETPSKVKLYTSVISAGEVAYSEQEKVEKKINPTTEQMLNALWDTTSPIIPVEVFLDLCLLGKDLNRKLLDEGRARLGGADSIHIATAIEMGVSEFHTSNGRLKKLEAVKDIIPFKIGPVRNVLQTASDPQQTIEFPDAKEKK